MDSQEYLRRSHPLALRWALMQRFQQHHLNDLAHVIKMVQENGKDIPKSMVQKSGKIDNGSFGSIFKATYKGQLFVMKCIGQGDGTTNLREAIHPVFLELCAVVGLDHPKVVRFEGMVSFFPDETQREQAELGFLFEFCENGNVYDNLFKKRTLSKLKLRLFIGCQIAEGMSYLHDESIIHRDLNSMNVVLTKDMNAKICDFGCARKIGALGHITPTTISGSPSYMSPEQLTGANQLTLKSDVWAMAVVLWELIGMQSPWVSIVPDVNDHTMLTQLIVKQRKRLPPLPDSAVPELIYPYVTKLLDKSFAEEPASRPAMREFCNILQGMYNKLFTPPPPPVPPPPATADIPGLQVLESPPSTSPSLNAVPTAPGGVPVLRRGSSFPSSKSSAESEAIEAGHDRKRAYPGGHASAQATAALDLADGLRPEDCEPRGICPVCGTQVTTAHRGRMRNSMGTYFHARCWESAQELHSDAGDPGAAPPPPRGAGHPSMDTAGPQANTAAAAAAAAAVARGNFRGVCPVCSMDVTAAHEGRRVDSRGKYLHAQCWESYNAALAPPAGGGLYGGAGEPDFGGEVRLM